MGFGWVSRQVTSSKCPGVIWKMGGGDCMRGSWKVPASPLTYPVLPPPRGFLDSSVSPSHLGQHSSWSLASRFTSFPLDHIHFPPIAILILKCEVGELHHQQLVTMRQTPAAPILLVGLFSSVALGEVKAVISVMTRRL